MPVTAIGEGGSTHGSPPDTTMTGRQMALYQALGKKDKQLASMYLGALAVLKHASNPDRLSLAAHGLRELLEKLPRFLDIPLESKPLSMKEKIRPLQQTWVQAQKHSDCLKTSSASDAIDNPLRSYLDMSDSFFSWFDGVHLTRKQQAAKVVRGLDPQKKGLPAPIEQLHVEAWDKFRDYFVGVSHHTINETFDEFIKWVDALESYLIDRLVPRTFDDFAALDAIIGEGETNG
jgi:hypothetical protein